MIRPPEEGEPIDELWRPVAELVEVFEGIDNLQVKGSGFSGRMHTAPGQYVLGIQGGKRKAPRITSISPSSGPVSGGQQVTITGENFVYGATVEFGLLFGTSVIFDSSTQIRVTTPAESSGAINIILSNPDGQTATAIYTYVDPPSLSSFTPFYSDPAGGSQITIQGQHFVNGATVNFNGTPATGVIFDSSTQLRATIPAHAVGGVSITVTNPDGQSGSLGTFAYQSAPGCFIIDGPTNVSNHSNAVFQFYALTPAQCSGGGSTSNYYNTYQGSVHWSVSNGGGSSAAGQSGNVSIVNGRATISIRCDLIPPTTITTFQVNCFDNTYTSATGTTPNIVII